MPHRHHRHRHHHHHDDDDHHNHNNSVDQREQRSADADHIADALEMRGDAKGAAEARNNADLVDRFIEVCRVTASSTFVGGACVLKVGWRAGAGCGS